MVGSSPPEAGMFACGVQLQPPLYTTQPMCSQGTTTIRVQGPKISVSAQQHTQVRIMISMAGQPLTREKRVW